MTVIIKSDVSFTAPNLPILSRLNVQGLVLGIRPAQGVFVEDISGNGAQLTPVGAPQMTQYGVQAGPSNFYKTDVKEPKNHTMIAGFRLRSGRSISGTAQIIGSLPVLNVNSGAGLYAGELSGGFIGASYRTSNPEASIFSPRLLIKRPVETEYVSPWLWVAVSVNYDSQRGTRYYSDGASSGALRVDRSNAMPASHQQRPRNNIAIGGYEDYESDNLWRFEFAEALVYNRALTDVEVENQFADSSGYMQAIGAAIGT